MTNVVCNDGQNITIKQNKTFSCVAASGARFTVTITKADGAHYTAVPDN